jgi:hypothetical protein
MARIPGNGARRRVTLTVIDTIPPNASVLRLSGGPFVAEAGHDTNYVCGACGRIIASVPGDVRFAGEKGPAVFVCYGCGANNLAP